MSRRVLVIAYFFPPIANSGTQRPLKFAKYLSRFGWEPTVMTAAHFDEQRLDESLLKELPPGLPIVRVPMWNEQVGRAIATMTFNRPAGKRLANALSWRLRTLKPAPDVYALWRPTATHAALKLHREIGFDAIYATGFPWTSLMVGVDVSKATGRPLVAEFRDLWAGEDLWASERRPHAEELAMEREVVAQASCVLALSPTRTKMLADAHPEANRAKFMTIQNGFDPIDMSGPAPQPHQRFRIVYTGIWKEGYNPSRLYDALETMQRSAPDLLRNVEVIMAGFAPGEAARRGLSPLVSEVGPLSHPDAISLMYSADLLFFAVADGPHQKHNLPGKLYEYLATGRPILAIADPEGDTGRLIRQVGGGLAVPVDPPSRLVEALSDACQGKLDVPPRLPEALAEFERSNLTRRLAEVLTAAVNGGPVDPGVARVPATAGRP